MRHLFYGLLNPGSENRKLCQSMSHQQMHEHSKTWILIKCGMSLESVIVNKSLIFLDFYQLVGQFVVIH